MKVADSQTRRAQMVLVYGYTFLYEVIRQLRDTYDTTKEPFNIHVTFIMFCHTSYVNRYSVALKRLYVYVTCMWVLIQMCT